MFHSLTGPFFVLFLFCLFDGFQIISSQKFQPPEITQSVVKDKVYISGNTFGNISLKLQNNLKHYNTRLNDIL